MGRPRTIPPKKERIDWTKAAILERKITRHLRWRDIADEVGMSSEVLRKLVYERPTPRWPQYTLKKVCKVLEIPYGEFEIQIPEPEGKKNAED